MSPYGMAAVAVLSVWLLLFALGNRLAARDAGRAVWLFPRARGRDLWAALAFRAGFALALAGPVIWPGGHLATAALPGLAGVALAAAGAMLGFGAQMAMGASWRVGVVAGETGALVTTGLYRISRNPAFLGQGLLLAGVALAVPGAATLPALFLFLFAATTQIRSEEAALAASNPAWQDWAAEVPRWIGWAGRSRG